MTTHMFVGCTPSGEHAALVEDDGGGDINHAHTYQSFSKAELVLSDCSDMMFSIYYQNLYLRLFTIEQEYVDFT